MRGELLDPLEKRGKVGRAFAGKLVMIPGGRGISWEGDDVGQVDAGIEVRDVVEEIEVEDLREQDDAVEIYAS